MTITQDQVPQTSKVDGCLPVLLRFLWLIVGIVALLFLAFFIAMRKAGIAADIAFWLIVVALILVRYIDITRFEGQTADGEPATLHHWFHYLVRLVLSAIGLYVCARILSHFKVL